MNELKPSSDLDIETVINRVLQAERDARAAITECERRAAATLREARKRARRIRERAERRIHALHIRGEQRTAQYVEGLGAEERGIMSESERALVVDKRTMGSDSLDIRLFKYQSSLTPLTGPH